MSVVLPVLILSALVVVFGAGLVFLTSLVGPSKPSAEKSMPYECGLVGDEKRDTKVSVKYYLVAILFILFDIEVIFIYPWAVIYKNNLADAGIFLFVEMMFFMAILIFGLFYIWKAGALDWE